MASLVAFVIGAGKNVGSSVASLLKEKGYEVAFGSRNPDFNIVRKQGYLPVAMDVSKADSIVSAFAKVNAELGAPSVVIYNAALFSPPTVPNDPVTIPAEKFAENVSIGAGVFTAAQQSLPGFRSSQLKDVPKAFIVTGNWLPFFPATVPALTGLGTEKSIEAYLIDAFSKAYGPEGIHFYFASMVSAEGRSPKDHGSSGPLHADVYWGLIHRKEQGNWDYRFTDDGKVLSKY